MAATRAVTDLLEGWRSGDDGALQELTPLVYDELRRLASRHMRGERADHTLQATALVNEAFVRLMGADVSWQNRSHFYAVAARLMRRILTDYAKARRRDKRGGGRRPTPLHETQVAGDGTAVANIVDIDAALLCLAEFDERKSDVLVLHYFGGLTYDEIAEALGVSTATVHRELRLGKAWLHNELANL